MLKREELLGRTFACSCGQIHTVDTRILRYAEDAVAHLPSDLASCVSGRRVAVLADTRTWAIAGRQATESLRQQGWSCQEFIVPDRAGKSPICDDVTFADLNARFPEVDAALAVGCGVVTDLTKWLAFEHGVPFAVLATAPTMNGFTSANVAPAIDGVKTLLVARAPVAVFAAPSIMAAAPFELAAAGLGDAIAKPVSTADWVMNHLFNAEPFCRPCSELINSLEAYYFEFPEHLRERRPQAIEALVNALLYSGIAMTMIGTSAPASGGEHLLSHTLDMMSALDGQEHDLHGRQVGVGTIVAAVLYEKVLHVERPEPVPLPDMDGAFWGSRADHVGRQYEQKIPVVEAMREKMQQGGLWREFVNRGRPLVRPPTQIKDCLRRAGAAHTCADIGCSPDRVRRAMLHMHEIRKRPTVVDLAWMLGILPGAVDDIIERWLMR